MDITKGFLQVLEVLHSVNLPLDPCLDITNRFLQVLEVLHSVNLPLELAGSNCLNEEILRSPKLLDNYHQMKVFASPTKTSSLDQFSVGPGATLRFVRISHLSPTHEKAVNFTKGNALTN